jgi:ribosomal protein S18 acetylase RimI-like enzyme
MPVTWTNSQDQVDWSQLETLYRLAPLGNKSAEHLRTVFTNSRYKFFAYEHAKLVAAGRALSDGADCSYICDVAVMPSHQGSGLGREMVSRLVEASQGHKKIILYSVPGKEGFYRKLGFMRLLTAMAIFENQSAAIERGHLGEA